MRFGRFKEYTPPYFITQYTTNIVPVPHYSSSISVYHEFQVIFRFTGRHHYRQWIIRENSTALDPFARGWTELSPKMIKFNPSSITSTQKERMFRALNRGLVGFRLSISDRKTLAMKAVEEAWNTLVTRPMSNMKLHLHIDFTLIHKQIVNRNTNHRVDIRELERDPVYHGTFFSRADISRQAFIESLKHSSILKNEIIVDTSRGTSCSICLEDFVIGCDKGVCMPCSHMFHGDCITRWLSTSPYCPLCRFEMPINLGSTYN